MPPCFAAEDCSHVLFFLLLYLPAIMTTKQSRLVYTLCDATGGPHIAYTPSPLSCFQVAFEPGQVYGPSVNAEGTICHLRITGTWGPTKKMADVAKEIVKFFTEPEGGVYASWAFSRFDAATVNPRLVAHGSQRLNRLYSNPLEDCSTTSACKRSTLTPTCASSLLSRSPFPFSYRLFRLFLPENPVNGDADRELREDIKAFETKAKAWATAKAKKV